MAPRNNDYHGPERVGQLRPSQLIHSFGIGGLIDLPQLSVIVQGLGAWGDAQEMEEIREERLLASIRTRMPTVRSLRKPPWEPETANIFDSWAYKGVPVAVFPQWLRCPVANCKYLGPITDGQFEIETNPYRPDRAAYRHMNCKRRGRGGIAVPVRFLLTCENGHLDEFPWVDYVHRRNSCGTPLLELSEGGVNSGPSSVYVRCRSCGAAESMSGAFGEGAARRLPQCRGRHPHLNHFEEDGCQAEARTLLLGASNAWFAEQSSALSIPTDKEPLPALVDDLWLKLEPIPDEAVFNYAIEQNPELRRLRNYPAGDVWGAIEARRNDSGPENADKNAQVDIQEPEWALLTNVEGAPQTHHFLAHREPPPVGYESVLEDVVKVERLREVVAFTGFTRLSAPGEGGGNSAKISLGDPEWLPGAEVHGEGLFIQFKESAVAPWEARYRDSDHYDQMLAAHKNWRERRGLDDLMAGWPGARYILVHTLSHLLMREFALECGYSASSIRERVYASTIGVKKAGVLIYTAASDSEGTLGGLVSLGDSKRLGYLLDKALKDAGICTSDPTCAEHIPGNLGDEHLHASACHACLFASETSCERGNRYLDRAALVPTIATTHADVAFFGPTVT